MKPVPLISGNDKIDFWLWQLSLVLAEIAHPAKLGETPESEVAEGDEEALS